MTLRLRIADASDAAALAAMQTAVHEEMTRRFGHGMWSSQKTEKHVLNDLRHARIVIALEGEEIAGSIRLQTKKPWAIDISYFTPVKKAIYVTGMNVAPEFQKQGVGRLLLQEAARQVLAWPAQALRLDAWDSNAGAGGFYSKCGFREVARVVYRNDPLIYFEQILAGEESILK